ncbi:ArnT family glycosyltransferase [Variovorax sp. HJSM1_2]|uniref:ArnT family glycosyltransferase n=1 Tax=Variovorax sp. HJSM1_2 TaxID=3366263 RepID=UPI003BE04B7E
MSSSESKVGMMTSVKSWVLDACAAVLKLLRGPTGWAVVLAVYGACALRNLELPGLYMDAINPDYLVARWLHPALDNPVWVLPGPKLPILGNLYHGTETLWLGLLTYSVLGTTVASARITHALFGAIIVLFVWLILRKITRHPLLALAVSVGLATDMAFLGSFRTQAYIILAGQMWMMGAIYLGIRSTQNQDNVLRSVLLCGISMGLAVYGYFVFLFFLPPVAALAICGAGRGGVVSRAKAWVLGFTIGMLPYIVGYLGLVYAARGFGPFIGWLQTALTGLKPTGASPSYLAGLSSVLANTQLGLSGIGNEMMMTDKAISINEAVIKPIMLAGSIAVCLTGVWCEWRRNPSLARVLLAIALLPVSYVLLAAGFGARLWAHHFTTLVSVSYLLLGVALYWLSTQLGNGKWIRLCCTALVALLVATNIIQQNRVHMELVRTGGAGMSSDALTVMSRSALEEKDTAVWYFPEWGFYMPFAFLTGNQVAYETDLTTKSLRKHRGQKNGVHVAFWKDSDRAQYIKVLQENGVTDIRSDTLNRRDGQPALYVLTGHQSQ